MDRSVARRAAALFGLLLACACAAPARVHAQSGTGEVRPAPTTRKTTKAPPRREAPPPPAPKRTPTADLTVSTKLPGVVVMLEGQERGTTDASGLLTLRGLRPGNYGVTLRHDDYREARHTVELAAGQNPPLQVTLIPLPGSLSVTLNVADAEVAVSNVGTFAGPVETPLAPGRYRVEASRPGYRGSGQTIDVSPNRPTAVSLRLEPLPTGEALSEAERLVRAGDHQTAIRVCEVVLAAERDNATAHALTGYAFYHTARFEQGVRHLGRALALGREIDLPAKLHAKTSAGEGLFSGRLTLRRGSVGFRSHERPELGFSVAAAKVYELKVEEKRGGRIAAQVGLTRAGQKREKKEKLYLHAAGAGPGGACHNCLPELQALHALIGLARL